jgi:hypothetical protein
VGEGGDYRGRPGKNVKIIKDDISVQKAKVAVLQSDVDEAQADLSALGGRNEGSSGGGSSYYSAMVAAESALSDANAALNTAKLRYQDEYDVLVRIAGVLKSVKESVSGAPVYDISVYIAARAAQYAEGGATPDALNQSGVDETDLTNVTVDGVPYVKAELADAYEAINDAQE